MTSDFQVGPYASDEELMRYGAIEADAFVSPPERIRPYLESAGLPNVRIIRAPYGDGRRSIVAGGLVVLPKGQWFGGRAVPMTGVAAVAVAPEFRARGTATQLLQAVLAELYEKEVPLSTLWPATQPLYRRVGYETAGMLCDVVAPAAALHLHDRTLPLRAAGPDDEAEIRSVYARWAAHNPGALDRNAFNWERVHVFREQPTRGYVVGEPGRVEGYTFTYPETVGPMRHDLRVHELVALTPVAAKCLLTFFADQRSVRQQVWWRCGPCDPLLALLPEATYTVSCRSPWMLRMVRVPKALEARGYPAGVRGELHLNVRDDCLPGNNARFTLEVAEGRGQVRPGGRGSFDIDVRGLAAMYSGFRSPQDLLLLGQAIAPEPELDLAASIFAGPMPVMRDLF